MEVILIIGGIVAAIWFYVAYSNKKRREYLLAKYRDEIVVDKIMRSLIWEGMSEEQLIDSWGRPVEKGQRVFKTKVTETFKYNKTGRNRFGSRVRIENGIVVGWEQK